MSVAAFTNNVGEFSKNKVVQTVEKGVYLGNTVDTQTNHTVFDQFSFKPVTLHGNRKETLPYSRVVISVSEDEPFVVREYFRPGNDVIWDYTVSKSLSLYFPTRFMLSPWEYRTALANAKSEAITKARVKLRDQKVQFGASLAEARKTANMIATNAKSILYAYRSLRHGNFNLAMKHLGISWGDIVSGKAIANRYLEYIYGWRPLMQDIKDGCDSLEQGAKQPDNWVVSASAGAHIDFDEGWIDNGFLQTRWRCQGRGKVAYKAIVTDQWLAEADSHGVINPLSIAWELMPFSFVADWFVPVGNVLESLSATAGLEFSSGYTSFSSTERFAAKVKGDNVVDPGYLTVNQYSFKREVLSGFLLPEFYARKNPFSTQHITSAIALIRSIL